MASTIKEFHDEALDKSKTHGYLSFNMLDFLKMEPEERSAHNSEGNLRNKKNHIKEKTGKTLEDLSVVFRHYEKEDLKKIISIDEFAPMITELVKKIGMEKGGRKYQEEFYYELIRAIEAGINKNYSNSESTKRIKIETKTKSVIETPY